MPTALPIQQIKLLMPKKPVAITNFIALAQEREKEYSSVQTLKQEIEALKQILANNNIS